MTCRTIALCFTDTASAPTLARAGAALARHHGAHLLGLHVLPDPVVHASISMYVTGEILNQIRARQRDTALEIETAFKKAAEAEGATPEWRCLEARLATIGERLCESARAADLENHVDFVTLRDGEVFNAVVDEFRSAGYVLAAVDYLNCADANAPEVRNRVVIRFERLDVAALLGPCPPLSDAFASLGLGQFGESGTLAVASLVTSARILHAGRDLVRPFSTIHREGNGVSG